MRKAAAIAIAIAIGTLVGFAAPTHATAPPAPGGAATPIPTPPPTFAVPAVVGLHRSTAHRAVITAHLVPRFVGAGGRDGIVVAQFPAAGTRLPLNGVVTMTLVPATR